MWLDRAECIYEGMGWRFLWYTCVAELLDSGRRGKILDRVVEA